MNNFKIEKFNIPEEVSYVTNKLKDAGFEAYLVGGCVRDLFMNKKPKDWDITTNALPEEIISLFEKTVYENSFGTVAIVNENVSDETLKVIEITPYRSESLYSDNRRPDNVVFGQSIEEDLKRRDFTINAIAYDPINLNIIDPYFGMADILKSVIRTVGDPYERLKEDGLRVFRAVRFHVELGFPIDTETEKAIIENKDILKNISKERIRDEFINIIMSKRPIDGMVLLKKLGLVSFIAKELEESFDIEQNKAHSYDVWTHLIKTLQHSADKEYPIHLRLASLFHDISKPKTRKWDNDSKQWTFYGHEVVGSRVTKKILENLKFSRETIDRVVNLVRWHMFFSDTEQITISAVRRMIVNVGKENIWDLMNLRICDRVGTGRPKEDPYRLRKYYSMIEEAMRDPISVSMLKINGNRLMDMLEIKGGPKIGYILNSLLNEVLDDPEKNNEDYLENRSKELFMMDDKDLRKLSEKGKENREEKDNKIVEEIRKRHFVK